MRATTLFALILLMLPGLANAQSFEIYAGAGPTIRDPGNSVAAGAGFSPHRRITVLVNFERTHLETQRRTDEHGIISLFRGGTLYVVSGEFRVIPLGRDRLGPYGFAGLAKGISKPNVNADFPNRITNNVDAFFVGGGLQVPLSRKVLLFGDARMMAGAEGIEGIVAVAPVRGGITIRF